MKPPTQQQLQKEIEILKTKNAELEKNKKYSQIVTENTSDNIGITTFDLKAEYLYVSPSVKQILGYEPKELIGHSFFDFIHADDKKIIFPLLKKYISKKIKKVLRIKDITESIEYRFKDKAGNWRHLQSTVNFFGSNLIAVTRDVSYQKETQTKLIQSENYLLALNKAKKILLDEFKEDTLQQFVKIIGKASNASRTYIFKNILSDDGKILMSQKAEYCADGIKPEIDNPNLQNMPINIFGNHWAEMLLSGKVINGKTSDFGQNERELLQSQNIKAIIIIPIIFNNQLLGIIGFDNCISERKWDNIEQSFLRSAADDFAQFINRIIINFQIKNENIRFKSTMDALDAVVHVADMETHEIIYLNKKGISLVGNKIGEKCYNVLQQDQTKPCDFCTNHLLLDENGNPKKPYVWEFKNTISKKWHKLSDQSMVWPNGRMVRVEIATDISEQKKIEKELRQSEDNLNEAQHLTKIGSWRLEIKENQLSWSDEVYNIFEVNKKETDNLWDIFVNTIHPDDKDYLLKEYFTSVKTKIPYNIEHRLLLSDGTIKIVNERCKTYYDENDKPTHSIGTIQDITEQINKEEELKEAKDFAENLLETANSIVITVDPEARITSFNKYAEKLTGYNKSEVIGKNWFSIFIDEKDKIEIIFENVLESMPNASQHENKIFTKSGDQRTINWSNSLIYNSAGNITGMLSIGEDITKSKQIEQDLIESEKRYRIVAEQKGQMVYSYDVITGGIQWYGDVPGVAGYNNKEFQQFTIQKWENAIHPDERELALLLLDNAMKKHKKYEVEYRFKSKTGDYKYIEDTGSFLYNDEGSAYLMIGVMKDISARKKIEINLRKERDLFSAGPVCTIVWDYNQNWRVLYVSKNIIDILGYTQTEFMHPDFAFASIIHPDDLDTITEEVDHYAKNNIDNYEQSYRMRLKTGGYIWFYDFNNLIRDDKGNIQEIRGYFFDQTAIKYAEQKLENSREQLDLAIKGTNIGLWDWKVQTGEIIFSERWAEIIGYTLDELSPVNIDTWSKHVHPDDLKKSNELLEKHFAGETDYYIYEARMKHKNGSWVWVLDRGKVFEWDKNGKPCRMAGTHLDITEQKESEMALNKSEEKLKSIFKSMDDIVFVIDKENYFVSVNADTSELLFNPQMFIGKKHHEIVSMHINKLYNKALINVKKGKTEEYEYYLEMPDGIRWYSLKISPILNNGKFDGSVSVVRNITERKNTEEALIKSKDELKELNTKLTYLVRDEVEKNRKKDFLIIAQSKQAAMGEMISSIAHQWRQPLNDIGLFIQSIQDSFQYGELTLDEINNTVAKTMNKLDYMSQTIDDFRNFFRSDKRKVSFSIADIIRKTLTLTEASFENNGIELIINLQENVNISNYPNEFSQALLNILNNAKDVLVHKKITDSKIIIKLRKKGKKIKLVITDNAGGINEDIMDKIFDPYFTTKSKLTGTGLGLYISKTIIERNMQGKLTARNKNNWAEFVIEFDC